jgi:hypothetical protein
VCDLFFMCGLLFIPLLYKSTVFTGLGWAFVTMHVLFPTISFYF